MLECWASGTQLIQELIAEGLYAVTRYQPQFDKVMRMHAQTAMILPRGSRGRRAVQQATTCSNRAPARLDGVVRGAEKERLNPGPPTKSDAL
jgi:hypothetical protein